MDTSFLKFQVEPSSIGDIGKIIFDCIDIKANTLSWEMLEALNNALDAVKTNANLKALLLVSNKPSMFIAGADLNQFSELFKDHSRLKNFLDMGHGVFNKLEALHIPTIAVIDGACVGGGLELALACTYRIATDNSKTLLGLPEVTLGLIPGWGGTQRLPRLVGLSNALEMILSGKTINAIKAWKIHLVDAVTPPSLLEESIQKFLFDVFNPIQKQKICSKRRMASFLTFLLEKNALGRNLLYWRARKAVEKKSQGRYQAPLIALQAIRKGYGLSLSKGLQAEIKVILEHLNDGLSLAPKLVHLFLAGESLKKTAGMPAIERNNENKLTDIEALRDFSTTSTAVIGSGTMGSSIAWLFANNGFDVRLKDLNWNVLGSATNRIHALFLKEINRKKMTQEEASLKFHRLSCCVDDTGFQAVDLVLECATENLETKIEILKEIETAVTSNVTIATNTSSLTVEELSVSLTHPERFIALHFFNPAEKMPLVEVVAGNKTSPQVLQASIEFCRKIGKTPLVVGDCPGFLVNRILACGLNEVIWMLQEGIPMKQIEDTLADFGLPMSPFLLSDQIGNDIGYKVSKSFEKAYGERMHCPELFNELYSKKLYGKKSGKGFYLYDRKTPAPNPEITKIVAAFKPVRRVVSNREINDRFILVMVNEATRCLQEKIVASEDYLDMALILGMGFPPFRGGLLYYARELGADYVTAQLKGFEKNYGPRFAVPEKID